MWLEKAPRLQRVVRIALFVILLPLALVFVGLPLLLLSGFVIPFGLLHNYSIRRRERRLRSRLRAAGRFLAWPLVAEHLVRGEGTLIIEQANKQGSRFWWTSDDVVSQSPASSPEFSSADYVCPDASHPFVAWCLERYTSPLRGAAVITEPTGITFPPGFVEAKDILSHYPKARVVASVVASRAE